jgi:hypothetical protein
MSGTIIIAILSLCGTCFGSIAGIMTANKLTNYRIGELEKKVDKHNNVIERVTILEQNDKAQWAWIDKFKEYHEGE